MRSGETETADTTRQPRPGERNGIEYRFVTSEVFNRLLQEGRFIEYATFAGKTYGTSIESVKDVINNGRACVLDIEMEVITLCRPSHFFSCII